MTADEARAQLGALAEGRAALADRVVTPWWYHPALAVLVAIFLASQGAQQWWVIGFAIYCAGLVGLVTAYRNLTGVWVSSWDLPNGRGVLIGVVAVLLAGFTVSLVTRFGLLPWWSALLSGLGCGLFVWWIGPQVDSMCRDQVQDAR